MPHAGGNRGFPKDKIGTWVMVIPLLFVGGSELVEEVAYKIGVNIYLKKVFIYKQHLLENQKKFYYCLLIKVLYYL